MFFKLRRWPLRNNHTATHLINYALKDTLGAIVDQKGSLVAPEKFRFDYSCKSAPSVAELAKIEDITNKFIKENHPIYSKDVPLALAKQINGLRAVFGEVYPDPVRVVSVGYDIDEMLKDPSSSKWQESSIEFCGGTHVAKTGDIKRFIILEDSALAKGVRRIVGVTGEEALQAQRAALEFEQTVLNLKKLTGSEFESALKTVGTVISRRKTGLILFRIWQQPPFQLLEKVNCEKSMTVSRKNLTIKTRPEKLKRVKKQPTLSRPILRKTLMLHFILMLSTKLEIQRHLDRQ